MAGVLTGEAAEALGLRAGTPVVAGAGDQAAQALAIGAIGPGVLGVQIGTSGVIVCGSDRSVAGAFCHALPGRWLRLDSMHSAGLCLAWYRGTFASERSFEELAEIAGAVTPGSDGLLFLPFLLGERASFASSVPAAFFGIRPGHVAPQFVRSILEGVAFELRRMLEAWVANGAVPTEARLVGGGAKDPVWASILANVLAIPVTQVARDSAFGAAVLAGISAQWWDEVPLAGDGLVVEPSATAADEYHAAYRRYAALHALLRSLAAERRTG